jgi:AcrR family transcriptional regulator
MTASAERGRHVRIRLLDAACELIAELGWGAVSTRALAERAGVRPGLVHYHFPAMRALLREAALTAIHRVLADAEPLFVRAASSTEAVSGMLTGLDAHTGRDPASLLLAETFLAATRDEELRSALAAMMLSFRDGLARRLARDGHADPVETATLLAAAFDGLVLHKALDPQLSSAALTPVATRLLTTKVIPASKGGGNR